MKNLFLTEIAKDYSADIGGVWTGEIEDHLLGKVLKAKPHVIYVDIEKMLCMYQTLFTLFHEIGHIKLCHFDRENKKTIEKEANNWALKEIGLINELNQPAPDYIACYDCIISQSPFCLNVNMNIDKTQSDYFICERAKCKMKISTCLKRQKDFSRGIVKHNYDLSLCEGCPRLREKCRLKLSVCLKSPKSIKKISSSKSSFIICKDCPQGMKNEPLFSKKQM